MEKKKLSITAQPVTAIITVLAREHLSKPDTTVILPITNCPPNIGPAKICGADPADQKPPVQRIESVKSNG